jgi:tetratricopeptide (TPR) repeat protein
MYVGGRLMEGGMAERSHARQVYESIVYRMQDPALLEWVDGTTFKMRVFPLEGRQEKRIVLSYTQKLPSLYGRMTYRFPAGHSMHEVGRWSFRARVRNGRDVHWVCDSHDLSASMEGDDLILTGQARRAALDRDVVLRLTDLAAGGAEDGDARFSSTVHEGHRYLMLRYRPRLPLVERRRQRHWVFLFESSGDRDPLLARAQIEVVRGILDRADRDDTFSVLTAGTRAKVLSSEPSRVSQSNVARAVALLEDSHLVGALDLAAALSAAAELCEQGENPHLVHLGTGITVLGARGREKLLQLLPADVTYVGVGVGKRWSRSFMKAAAAQTGGYYTQINPDENIPWRTFELVSTLNTSRLLSVAVRGAGGGPGLSCCEDSAAGGEEICAITRMDKGARLPEAVSVQGVLDGEPWSLVLPVCDVAGGADYLPRIWARLKIDRLLADGGEAHRAEIVALSKAMYVMSPYTSLLVLENEAMYEQYGVDRGRKDHWALYPCPREIPVVREPLRAAPAEPSRHGPPERDWPKRILGTILVRLAAPFLQPADLPQTTPESSRHYTFALTALDYWGGAYALGVVGGGGGGGGSGYVWGMNGRGLAFDDGVIVVNESRTTFAQARPVVVDGLRSGRITDIVNMTVRIPNSSGAAGSGEPLWGHELRYRYGDRGGFAFADYSLGLPDANGRIFFGGDGELPVLTDLPVLSGLWDYDRPVVVLSGGSVTYLAGDVTYLQGGPLGAIEGGVLLPGGRTYSPAYDLDAGAWSGQSLTAERVVRTLRDRVRPLGMEALEWDERREDRLDRRTYLIKGLHDLDWDALPVAADELTLRQPTTRLYRLENAPGAEARARLLDLLTGHLTAEGLYERYGTWPSPPRPRVLYQRPVFSGHRDYFSNLTLYAPGLNTSLTDVLAVLAAEAPKEVLPKRGRIDPAARKLIDIARGRGWQSLTIGEGGDAVVLTFDGAGRYAYQRRLESGLRERVVCDGRSLLHLYEEIGLAARREVSRFHRADLLRAVPWLVPPVEDLAVGADVGLAGQRTVAISPPQVGKGKGADGKEAKYAVIHLVFADDGRLAERRLLVMPEGRTVLRETYAPDAKVILLDGDGKVLSEANFGARAAAAPDLRPDTADLVVLPMPMRTPSHVVATRNLNMADRSTWKEADALAYVSATWLPAPRAWRGDRVIRDRFLRKGDRRIGFYVLLLAADGHGTDAAGLPGEVRSTPPGRYIDACGRDKARLENHWAGLAAEGDGFIHRLAGFRLLWDRMQAVRAGKDAAAREACQRAVLRYADSATAPIFTWALLCEAAALGGKANQAALAEAFDRFGDVPGFRYAARYESARALHAGGRGEAAAERFRRLYADTFDKGVLPPIDGAFHSALTGRGWKKLISHTASALVERGARLAAIRLAWQCHASGDATVAGEAVAAALGGGADDLQPVLRLATLRYCWHTSQWAGAEEMISALLADERLSGNPALWRLAAKIAANRGRTADVVERLARAVDIEYRSLPEKFNIEAVRRDYGQLMSRYQQLAKSMAAGKEAPKDVAAGVIRTADRWRSLDTDPTAACQAAARALRQLGEGQLAWEYLTTPLAGRPNESQPWVALAQALRKEGGADLADQAYANAFEIEPTNAQILWDRAELLRQRGRSEQARRLYRRITEGDWGPKYRGVQSRARRALRK